MYWYRGTYELQRELKMAASYPWSELCEPNISDAKVAWILTAAQMYSLIQLKRVTSKTQTSTENQMSFYLFIYLFWHRVRRPALSLSSSLSFITKWGSRISRERFDLELPNFTGSFMSVGSTTTRDMTSLCTSGRKLWTFEKGPKMTPPTAST